MYKLLQIAITIPVSSATCKRSFSFMKRLKSWLRSNMNQERFSYLSILSIERDIANLIDTELIVDQVTKNDRRIILK